MDASDLCKTHFGLTAQGPVSFLDIVRSVDDADRRRIEDAFSYSIASGTILDVEYRAVAPDSTPRWIYLRGEPVRDPSDAVVKLTGVSLDITDRKYAEHRLELLNDSLEQRVRERTTELEQTNRNLADEVSQRQRIEAAFIQAQKMEALGKLTGGVAHDFNNVLQIINGNLQLLGLSAPLSERQQRHLQASIDGVTRGAKLASQLLSFARKQPLDPVVLNVGQMLRAMDNMFRRALGEEIATETIVGGGLWNVHVDSNHLENVLLNLAINARDAMGQGGKLTLEAANVFLNDDYARQHDEVKAGQYVVITMTDTGCGMTEEVIKQAFEPFYTTKSDGHGTGLGLSMVHGFVKQSGGHVKIYSEVGEGTAIKVYLPRSFAAVSAPVVLFDLDVPSGTETILVAEDDPIVRATVVETLNSLGYKTLAAEDGASALTILKSGASIDLLFSDVVMPGNVRSPDLAREAKRMLPNLAVLFTSGYTENAIVHGGRLDPGVALISKPYQREELARKLRHVLANEAQRSMLHAGQIKQPLKRAPSKLRTILLVDDDVNVREATAELLTMFEFEVETAASGEAAIQLVDAGKYDAVICDVELGGISGIELAHHCRRADPNVRIVIASGHGSLGIEREAPHGASILTKPYSVEQLRSALIGV
ncbi:response regulator [Caballeronia sordidicola]|uniref:response regulator n=1 Tax=Caballeronia sordidicola TaxID=196367 RepID=UPI00094D0697|nr:response regulator [Caballeronia sordidicola]